MTCCSAKFCQARQWKTKSADDDDDDQDLGLWVDTAFFRKLTTQQPRTIIHSPTRDGDTYYLHLADIVLGKKPHAAETKPTPKSRKRKAP